MPQTVGCQVWMADERKQCQDQTVRTIVVHGDDNQSYKVRICTRHLSIHNYKAASNRVTARTKSS